MIIPPAHRLSDVKEYYFSKKLKEIREMNASGKNIINLGIGSPDLLPPSCAIETLKNSLNDQYFIPYYGGKRMNNKLSFVKSDELLDVALKEAKLIKNARKMHPKPYARELA